MHDDSSTIAGLRRVLSHGIEKWSDKNHTCKGFDGALYALRLSPELVQNLYSNFITAIVDNLGDGFNSSFNKHSTTSFYFHFS